MTARWVMVAWAVTGLALLCANGNAQTGGTVTFGNNNSCRLSSAQTGLPITTNNNVQAALYWAPLGSTDFVPLGAPTAVGFPLAGLFGAGTRTTGPETTGGAAGQFQVRAWGGGYMTFEKAQNQAGVLIGQSAIVILTTGNPPAAPPLPPASLALGGLQGFVLGRTPSLSQPPTNRTALAGRTVSWTITADGDGSLGYQWQLNGTNLTDSARLNGSTATSLSISNVTLADAGNYQVVVTNVYGAITSPPAVLTVAGPPVLGSASLSNDVFTLAWTAAPGLTYQPQYSTNLAAANWFDLGGPVAATNDTAFGVDLTPFERWKFYRVLVLP